MANSKIVSLDDYHKGFKPLDQFNFHHTLSDRKGINLVLFKKESCSSCAYWYKLLLNYQRANPQTCLYLVDVELDQALANEFDLFHLPVIQIYKDGDYYGEVQCEAGHGNVSECVQKALSQPPQEHP